MEDIKLSIAIIDDENKAIRLVESLSRNTDLVEEVYGFTDPVEAKLKLSQLEVDVVFLDIHIGKYSGLDVHDDLREIGVTAEIVFVTAYDNYAIEALKRRALDYFVKPIEMSQLQICLSRLLENKKSKAKNLGGLVRFNNLSGCIFIVPDEIGYITADVNYSHIFFIDGRTETVSLSIGKVIEKLPEDQFIRVDRSHVLNARYLYKIDLKKKVCILRNAGQELSFSPTLEGLRKLRR